MNLGKKKKKITDNYTTAMIFSEGILKERFLNA